MIGARFAKTIKNVAMGKLTLLMFLSENLREKAPHGVVIDLAYVALEDG
jgi:hypothetical protein